MSKELILRYSRWYDRTTLRIEVHEQSRDLTCRYGYYPSSKETRFYGDGDTSVTIDVCSSSCPEISLGEGRTNNMTLYVKGRSEEFSKHSVLLSDISELWETSTLDLGFIMNSMDEAIKNYCELNSGGRCITMKRSNKEVSFYME